MFESDMISGKQKKAVVLINEKAVVKSWDRDAAEIFGISEEQAKGKLLPDILFSKNDKNVFQELLNQITQADDKSYVTNIRRFEPVQKKERLPDVELFLKNITFGKQNIIAAVFSQSDRTYPVQQDFLESIYNGVDTAIFVIDVTDGGDFVFAGLNPAHERVSGMQSDWIKGRRPEDLAPVVPEDACRQIRANYQRCLDSGKMTEYEEMIPMGGKETWWLTRLTPLKNADGRIYRIVGTSTFITEHVETNRQLTLFKQFAESSIQGFGIGTQDGGIHYMNPKLCEITGIENFESVTETSFLEFYPPAQRQRVIKEVIPQVMEKGHWSGELQIINQKGESIPTEENYFLIRSEKSEQPYLAAAIMDISDKKEVEARLQEYQDHLEDLVELRTEAMNVTNRKLNHEIKERKAIEAQLRIKDNAIKSSINAIAISDLDGTINYVNPAFIKLWGYKSEDNILGRNATEFWKMEDKAREVMSKMQTEGAWFGKLIAQKKNGAEFPVQVSASIVLDEANQPVAMMSSFIDISVRQAARVALEKSEQKFKDLINEINDGFFTTNADGILTFVNPALVRIHGCASEDELLGKSFADFLSDEKREFALNKFRDAGQDKKPEIIESEIVRKDGEKAVVQVNADPIKDADGEFLGTRGVIRDVSEIKKAEHLLHQTLKDLERSNRDLQNFAYAASHDLQEPLRMVISYLQLIEKRYKNKLDSDALDFIDFAVDGASRMKILINDLLQYSRVNTQDIVLNPTDLNDVVKQVTKNLEYYLEENEAEIRYDKLPVVMGDEGQLLRLFQNLISNAVKFRDEHKPVVTIDVEEVDDYFEFSVSDNGIGIEKAYLEKIFILFQRLNTKKKYPGTGIGLATCKRIVEKHNGKIWVQSEPGEGTTFYFTLKKFTEN